MTSRISVELDTRGTAENLGRMLRLLTEPRPALEEIGEYLIVSTRDRFPKGVAPSGEPWAPNTPFTLARKKDARPLFGESGKLAREILKYVQDASVEVGSNEVYASTQQFGAEAFAFQGIAPWGDVPARPFLGLSVEDAEAVLDIVQEHLEPAD